MKKKHHLGLGLPKDGNKVAIYLPTMKGNKVQPHPCSKPRYNIPQILLNPCLIIALQSLHPISICTSTHSIAISHLSAVRLAWASRSFLMRGISITVLHTSEFTHRRQPYGSFQHGDGGKMPLGINRSFPRRFSLGR